MAAASVVSIPGLPLIPIIYSSQVVNAVILPFHVIALTTAGQKYRCHGRLCDWQTHTARGLGQCGLDRGVRGGVGVQLARHYARMPRTFTTPLAII